jgi:hypothetical protein
LSRNREKSQLYRLKKELQDNDEFAEQRSTTSSAGPVVERPQNVGSREVEFHLKHGAARLSEFSWSNP